MFVDSVQETGRWLKNKVFRHDRISKRTQLTSNKLRQQNCLKIYFQLGGRGRGGIVKVAGGP